MANYRTHGYIYKSDETNLEVAATFQTYTELAISHDVEVRLVPSGVYDVTGYTTIKEVSLFADSATLDVAINNGSYFEVSDALFLRGAALTGFKVRNPSVTSAVVIRLIVGGS